MSGLSRISITLNRNKEQTELQAHINYILYQFNKINKIDGIPRQYQEIKPPPSEYLVKNIIPFNTKGWELRDHCNMLSRNFYKNCVLEPLLQYQKFDDEDPENFKNHVVILITAQRLSKIYGFKQSVILLILWVIMILMTVADLVKMSVYKHEWLFYLLISLYYFISINTSLYMIKCWKFCYYMSAISCLILVVASIYEVMHIDMLVLEVSDLIIDIIQIIIVLILSIFLETHLFKLEMSVQRLRMLFGFKYEPLFKIL